MPELTQIISWDMSLVGRTSSASGCKLTRSNRPRDFLQDIFHCRKGLLFVMSYRQLSTQRCRDRFRPKADISPRRLVRSNASAGQTCSPCRRRTSCYRQRERPRSTAAISDSTSSSLSRRMLLHSVRWDARRFHSPLDHERARQIKQAKGKAQACPHLAGKSSTRKTSISLTI
jgi:hypothetical protein